MTSPPAPTAGKGALVAWALYDWANSSFAAVITTFVFAAYFTKAVAVDPVTDTSQWGYAISLSALLVAFSSPLMGAIADNAGRRKPWLFVFTAVAVAATGLLWLIKPDPAYVLLALVLVGVGNYAFEAGTVFYNAMLPDLVAKPMVGRLSGWAWGLGYAGGLVCLAVALVGFVQTETPWFGVGKDQAANVRAVAVLVAVWFGVFAVPLFLFTPDTPSKNLRVGDAIGRGWATFVGTLRRAREHKSLVRFVIARMFYIDGLTTLFAFGGIYAAGTFGMSFADLILFGIGMNVTAGIGAALFAWIDDWIGPKPTILISIAGLIALGTALLLVETKTLFWVFGLPLGLFVGPAQAASRSFMAHLAPPHLRTEMFGLLAFSGKATAFLGPAVLAVVTGLFDSQRAGMASIIVFFVLGMIVLWPIADPRAGAETVADLGRRE